MSKLLIVVDMQNDFVTGTLGTIEAKSIVEKVEEKITEELSIGTAVIFTKDTHDKNYLLTQEGRKLPVEHCIKGTEGWKLVPQLESYELACPIIEKNTFGSKELAKFVSDNFFDEIELIGLCTDICVISNALLLKAIVPETKISVDAKCCAGVTPKTHQNALEAMKVCQIEIKE